MLDMVRSISDMVDIHYIRQKEPKGLGDAIYCARSFIGDEPFAVMLGDDIVDNDVPCLKQLMSAYEEYRTTILGVQSVAPEDANKFTTLTDEDQNVKTVVIPNNKWIINNPL